LYKPAEKELFKRILEISMKGIKKLIQTYDKSEKLSIKQTLNLYTNILSLDTPNLFDNNQDISSVNIDTVFKNITKVYTKPLLVVIHNTFRLLELEKSDSNKRIIYNGLQEILRPHNEKIKIWIRENLTC
jgi:archaellum component FlaC